MRLKFLNITLLLFSFVYFFLFTPLAFAANYPPTVGTITPSSGSSKPNETVSFITTYSDPDGWQNIQYVWLLINTSTNGARCFYGSYTGRKKCGIR